MNTGSTQKPDGIYQLIRQILDAKKRGQAQQQQQQQHHNLNFSGADDKSNRLGANLTLASQSDGKSLSTSALGNAANVDRWGVVMELLAESRKKEKEQAYQVKEQQQQQKQQELGAQGKRNSKQLDKFKLAAQSAAAATKHQRSLSKHLYHVQQQNRERQAKIHDLGAPPNANYIDQPTTLHSDQDQQRQQQKTQHQTQTPQTQTQNQTQASLTYPTQAIMTDQTQASSAYLASTHHAYGDYNTADLIAAATLAVPIDSQESHQIYQQQNYQMLNVGSPHDGMQSTSGKLLKSNDHACFGFI